MYHNHHLRTPCDKEHSFGEVAGRGHCLCGQIPREVFFCPGCDCSGGKNTPPIHDLGCKLILWMNKRNQFIKEYKPNPPLQMVKFAIKEEKT